MIALITDAEEFTHPKLKQIETSTMQHVDSLPHAKIRPDKQSMPEVGRNTPKTTTVMDSIKTLTENANFLKDLLKRKTPAEQGKLRKEYCPCKHCSRKANSLKEG